MPATIKLNKTHFAKVSRLKLLTSKLTDEQTDILEELMKVMYDEGSSAGYRQGNPNWDED